MIVRGGGGGGPVTEMPLDERLDAVTAAYECADKALRHASHVHHTAKPENKEAARELLRAAAVAYTAAAAAMMLRP